MRSRILLVISAMLVFGLGIVVYAYNTSGIEASAAACCSCCTESCPMKKGEKGTATATAATADQKAEATHSCCGDSCPMKKGDKTADGKAEGHSCCGDSCAMKGKAGKHEGMKHDMKADGHSCPMMMDNKDGKATHAGHTADHKMTGEGHSCCCPCCGDKEKAKAPAKAV